MGTCSKEKVARKRWYLF